MAEDGGDASDRSEESAAEGDDAHQGEAAAVAAVDQPATVDSLAADLRQLGVTAGDVVLVHASLSAIGWVAGGAPAVVDALREAVGPDGTLAMPTHSTQLSDPRHWENPPIPDDWQATFRETAPPYRPDSTPTRGMGAVAECFRTYPEVARSRHPTVSFAAWGADADRVVADHALDDPLGAESPLGALSALDAAVLRVGTDANTSLHLAEHHAAGDDAARQESGGPMLVDGERRWVAFQELPLDRTDDFRAVEAAFEEAGGTVDRGTVGAADATLLSQQALVDFAAGWFRENR
jgi:aminoglycoside 3-N-acetyltransferase